MSDSRSYAALRDVADLAGVAVLAAGLLLWAYAKGHGDGWRMGHLFGELTMKSTAAIRAAELLGERKR